MTPASAAFKRREGNKEAPRATEIPTVHVSVAVEYVCKSSVSLRFPVCKVVESILGFCDDVNDSDERRPRDDSHPMLKSAIASGDRTVFADRRRILGPTTTVHPRDLVLIVPHRRLSKHG